MFCYQHLRFQCSAQMPDPGGGPAADGGQRAAGRQWRWALAAAGRDRLPGPAGSVAGERDLQARWPRHQFPSLGWRPAGGGQAAAAGPGRR